MGGYGGDRGMVFLREGMRGFGEDGGMFFFRRSLSGPPGRTNGLRVAGFDHPPLENNGFNQPGGGAVEGRFVDAVAVGRRLPAKPMRDLTGGALLDGNSITAG